MRRVPIDYYYDSYCYYSSVNNKTNDLSLLLEYILRDPDSIGYH